MSETLAVYWDGYGLGAASSGVYVHARCLGQELNLLGAPPVVVGPPGSAALLVDLPVHELSAGRLGRLKPVWPERVGAWVERQRRADPRPYILHGLSNFNLPTWRRDRRRRLVLTIHDLIPFLAPDGVSRALQAQLALLMPRAVRAADRIVCVSAWTKRTVLERFPDAADKCVVIANGIVVGPPAMPADALMKAPAKAGGWLDLLYIARFEPYKRHRFLLELVQRSRLPLRLTMVTDLAGQQACASLAPELVRSGRLLFRANQSLAEIGRLHEASDLYVSPSLFEGYGLPAASSLAHGRPVVYLAGSGIDEVVGRDVGIPLSLDADIAAWDAAISAALARKAASDFPEKLQAHLATLTTWKNAAQALYALYNGLT